MGRFRAAAGSDDVVHAYARLLGDPNQALRERAAAAWVAWEDAVISFETNGRPGAYSARAGPDRLAFVRICTHYFADDAWLQDGELLRNAHVLNATPGISIDGRLDLGSPLKTAWDLRQAWPSAELLVVEDAGHTGSDGTRSAVLESTERVKH